MLSDLKLSIFLALRTIWRADKGSLVLTVLIMLVVFLNLLFIDAVFAGISAAMDKGKINYQYGEVIIEPIEGEKYISGADEITDRIKDFYYVRSVTERLRTGGILTHDKDGDGRDVASFSAGIIGINPETDNSVFDLKSKLIDGRYLRKNETGKAMLGADAAGGYGSSVFPDDLEGVRVGDTVSVKYDNGLRRDYEIVGIYKTKNFDTDSKMIVTEKDLDSVLATGNMASEIIVRLTDPNLSSAALRDFGELPLRNFVVSDWKEKLSFGRTINKSFDMIGSILRIIGSFVAGLVIFIIIFVDIVNRRKQIGILKAIGIPQNAIMNSFVIRGMFYTLAGMFLGYLLMRYGVINFFTAHPLDFPMGDMVPVIKEKSLRMSVILFVGAGFIGSLLPTVKEVRKKILVLMK